MHAYLMLLLFGLLIYIFYKYNKQVLCAISGFCFLIVLGFVLICVNLGSKAKDIPFISVEDSETIEIKEDGVVLLNITSSAVTHNEFYITSGTVVEDIQKYLVGNSKPVYFKIKSGQDILYSNNLGVLTSKDAQSILDLYNSWKANGVLPREKIMFHFLFMYFEV